MRELKMRRLLLMSRHNHNNKVALALFQFIKKTKRTTFLIERKSRVIEKRHQSLCDGSPVHTVTIHDI